MARAERRWTKGGLVSRLFSLGLMLALIVLSSKVIGQSQQLALLRDQVTGMERRLGSWGLPENDKIWIQQIAKRPGNYAWHMRVPPIKAFDICEAVPQDGGPIELISTFNWSYHEPLPQQTVIRLSRTSLQQKGVLYLIAFGNVCVAPEYTRGPVRLPLNSELFEVRAFQDREAFFELDEPVPLFEYRVKQQWIDTKLAEGAIDAGQAQYLATPHVWYFGTPKAMDKLRKSASYK